MLQQRTIFFPFIATAALLTFLNCTPSWALNSCEIEHPSEVVNFTQGSSAPSLALSPNSSNPSILLRTTSDLESLRLGIGGSITLQFIVPVVNYPAAGALTVERPKGAAPCSAYPVQAEISGSIDGEHFIPLGTTCETAAFDLGAFPWISYVRIQDVTDTLNPVFGSTPIGGFDLRSVSGPGCLKYEHCAVPSTPDSAVTNSTDSSALSLSSIGDDFVFEQQASFEEYGNGSARLTGTVHRKSDPSTLYDVIIGFTGRVEAPPEQSPVLELKPSAYSAQGGTVDPSSWYYYRHVSGVILGKGARNAEELPIQNSDSALQIGFGANGRDTALGAWGRFTYGTVPSQGAGELRVGLTSCSSSPTPAPQDPPPTCKSEDISNTLALLDNSLRSRVAITNRATTLLIRHNRSRVSLRFKTSARAKVLNLYALAWTDVWRHERVIQTCSPSVSCFDVLLEPTQAALAASARALDSAVDSSLRYVQKRVRSRGAKRALKGLMKKHNAQRTLFEKELAGLPGQSTRCQ